MDFMKLLKSLDDFLYEVVGWIVFYPITMVRSVFHPIAMLRYSDVELSEAEEEQYTDTLNPPIFLLITLFLVYVLGKLVLPEFRNAQVPAFLSTDANMLLFRGVTFSIFPVLMAVNLLRHQGKRIDRRTLRAPFYGQCFITAPFALVASSAATILGFHNSAYVLAGLALFLIALVWYIGVEIQWFSSTIGISKRRAAWNVLGVVVFTNVLVFSVLLGIVYMAHPEAFR